MKSESQLRVPVRTDVSVNSAPALTAGAVIGVVVLAAIFFSYRASDVGQLPSLLHEFLATLGRERVVRWTLFGNSVLATLIAALIVCSWFGLGAFVQRLMKLETESFALRIAWQAAIGAGLWSLLWFALGMVGLFRKSIALGLLLVGLGLAARAIRPTIKEWAVREKARHHWLERVRGRHGGHPAVACRDS